MDKFIVCLAVSNCNAMGRKTWESDYVRSIAGCPVRKKGVVLQREIVV